MDLSVLRRKAGTAALVGFRMMPDRVKRSLVRAGTPGYTVGAACLIEHDGEVLLLWQPHRHGWTLPGGLLGRGEDPDEAVRREVSEETGLTIDPGDPVAVGVHPDTRQVDVIYRVSVHQRPQVDLATEARKAQWWRLEDLTETDLDTRRILALVAHAERDHRPGRLVEGAA